MRKLIYLMLISLAACQADNKKQTKDSVKFDTSASKIISTTEANNEKVTEYFDWSSARVNRTIPMISSYNKVKQQLGSPDSVVTPDYDQISVSYFDQKFKYCYYKGLTFEKYADSLVLMNVNFEKTHNYPYQHKVYLLTRTPLLRNFKNSFRKPQKTTG